MRAPPLSLLACAVLLPSLAAAAATDPTTEAPDTAPVTIEIKSPQPGEVVKNKVHLAPVRGRAISGSGAKIDFDVLIAIDVSESTRYPSGIDVDGDDELGFNPQVELVAPGAYPDDMVCSDPDDTVLAAEILAAGHLLTALKPGPTRVGVITFSGEVDPETGRRVDPFQQDAWVAVELTEDFDRVSRVLGEILERGPFGATNMAAAIHLSVVELAGLSGAESVPRADAKRVILFLTDGVPTFPFGKAVTPDPEDTEAAIHAARLARKAGITINSFALGRQALASPVAVTEMARITVGTYTPVRNPGDIISFLQGITFANVEDVVITNLTTSEVYYDVSLSPDGTFSGFVPVVDGHNVVQVTALASDGGEESLVLALEFEKSGLTERELALELERIKRRNKELMLLVERKRIQSFRERQRKRILIEAEEATSTTPAVAADK